MILKNIKQADVYVQQTFLEVPISLKPIYLALRERLKPKTVFLQKIKH